MKKNVVKTIRVNDKLLRLLEKNGYTVQQLFDEAIAKKVTIKTKIEFKAKGKKK